MSKQRILFIRPTVCFYSIYNYVFNVYCEIIRITHAKKYLHMRVFRVLRLSVSSAKKPGHRLFTKANATYQSAKRKWRIIEASAYLNELSLNLTLTRTAK